MKKDFDSRPARLRLNVNGSLDTSFRVSALTQNAFPPPNLTLDSLGRILFGGSLYEVNGVPRHGLARLSREGALDTAFVPSFAGGLYPGVSATVVQPDGRICVGGFFSAVNGLPINSIARLNSDGSLDTSFDPQGGADIGVSTLLIQPDARIVVGGYFTKFGGARRPSIARLNSNGSVDLGFAPTLPQVSSVFTLGRASTGAILAGGTFCSAPPPDCGDDCYDDCDENSDCVRTIRIRPDPRLQLFAPAALPDGRQRIAASVWPGRKYILQSSTDLFHWSFRATNVPPTTSLEFFDHDSSPSSERFYRLLEDR
jgi:uncharacterized delta-60 repeat protein